MKFCLVFILPFAFCSALANSSPAANPSLSKDSQNSEFLTIGSKKSKAFSDIQALNQFTVNNSPLKIHNKALELLKNKNRTAAVLLLKKNFYQNLFPPSYFLINQLEEPVSFSHILFLIGFIIISLITSVFFIFYLKRPYALYLKNLVSGLFVFFLLLTGHFLLLKNKVSLLEESYLKLAPVETAPSTILQAPLEDLIVLKKQGQWLKIKNKNKQTGWISNQQIFHVF